MLVVLVSRKGERHPAATLALSLVSTALQKGSTAGGSRGLLSTQPSGFRAPPAAASVLYRPRAAL